MSPEQVSGSEAVDGRSDIFSAGVVLYELLSGKKPFHAEQPTAIITKILHENPTPLDQLVPGLPPQLAAAVHKSLAKRPADRFATASEFAKELQWIRKALQAMSEGTDSLDETRFASPSEIRRFQQALEVTRTPGSAMPAAEAPGAPAAPESERKWLVPAGIAAGLAVAAIAGVIMFSGGSSTSEAESAVTTPPALTPVAASTPAASPSPADPAVAEGVPASAAVAESAPDATGPNAVVAPEVRVRVESAPDGAAISLNGRNTNLTTPATVVITGEGPHRVGLSRRGYVAREARLTSADLQRGTLSLTLNPVEPTMVPVTIASTYPVEVYDGSSRIAAASESHELEVASGSTLSVRSQEYLLSAPIRVEERPVQYQAPALGYLTVLTRYETCNVRVGERDLGYPPITRLPLVAGQHRIDIVCPTGQNPQGQLVTVPPNDSTTARIF
jgi:hypothetical protein